MPRIPAMMMGMSDLKIISVRVMPMKQMPTPERAVPYAAPMLQNTRAAPMPMNPKMVYMLGS